MMKWDMYLFLSETNTLLMMVLLNLLIVLIGKTLYGIGKMDLLPKILDYSSYLVLTDTYMLLLPS